MFIMFITRFIMFILRLNVKYHFISKTTKINYQVNVTCLEYSTQKTNNNVYQSITVYFYHIYCLLCLFYYNILLVCLFIVCCFHK